MSGVGTAARLDIGRRMARSPKVRPSDGQRICVRGMGVEICASPTKAMLHAWNMHAFGERQWQLAPIVNPIFETPRCKNRDRYQFGSSTSPSPTSYRPRNSASIYLVMFSSGRPPHICVRHTVISNLYQPLRTGCGDSSGLLTVSTMIPVIWYGSALLAGLLSSK